MNKKSNLEFMTFEYTAGPVLHEKPLRIGRGK